MRKNKKSAKQRKASAKRGDKKSKREKVSRSEKHLRTERRKKVMAEKGRKIQELIDKLSGTNSTDQHGQEGV